MVIKLNHWYVPAALLLLSIFTLVALILSVVGIHNVSLASGNKYGLVFDAGSSHTSLFVYQWPADKENNTGVVSQTFSCHVNGSGISSYADNPPKAGSSLRECLDAAMTVIPSERQRESPAYLGATAGMRLLRQSNETAALQVLEEVGKAIQQYPVSFRGARIITGQEEGAYGWITINYLLSSFIEYSAQARDWIHPASAGILGALDLGGASTQISFVPASLIANATRFRLYGFNYSIYTHSYLCYGQNQALRQVLQLIINSTTTSHFQHPCYPINYTDVITTASIYDSPCASPPHLGSSTASRNVTLVGTGNATLCRETVQKIFNFSNCSHNESCGFNGVYQPQVNGKFLAFSAYFYTFSFLNLTETHPLDKVEKTIQEFCAKTWDELKSSYPKQNEDRLRNYCASANYILTLLLYGYGFSSSTWENIAFRMQAANSDIGWTLGYMLNLTNMIPSEDPRPLKGHEPAVWAASIFFIAATLLTGFILFAVFLVRSLWRRAEG
ncbi:ectonucleoside triphosphate diphosphohydrolase 8 [Hemicordylus capensis]|uniref:ectonucleoside triphosphate diphosphohydrolase 8 n=1 Tax=Hemicordylus capensis TaxID=884348 RepID=UPI0023039BB4|nr:ectonucleoside triphosphate diphosphohydrolase 8 [Hemicordylus capensis]